MSEAPRPGEGHEPAREAVPRGRKRSRPFRIRRVSRAGAPFLAGVALASVAWWAGASGAQLPFGRRGTPGAAGPTTAQLPAATVGPVLELSEAFIRIAEVSTPAVVRIETRLPAQ